MCPNEGKKKSNNCFLVVKIFRCILDDSTFKSLKLFNYTYKITSAWGKGENTNGEQPAVVGQMIGTVITAGSQFESPHLTITKIWCGLMNLEFLFYIVEQIH